MSTSDLSQPKLTIILGLDGDAMASAAVDRAGSDAHIFPEVTAFGIPLHPSKHAAIAEDIIADSAVKHQVIATHSDVILLRVQRRVAEGALSGDDVLLVWMGEGEEVRSTLGPGGYPKALSAGHRPAYAMLEEAGHLARINIRGTKATAG